MFISDRIFRFGASPGSNQIVVYKSINSSRKVRENILLNNRKLTGFPIKDASFSKFKNISDLLSENKEVKIKENMD